jgi:hypothetical protein
MLTISSGGLSRRSFLRVGALGLGGLTWSNWLGMRAWATRNRLHVADKSVVFLFLSGGPPQHETFDPKADVSDSFCSVFGSVPTRLPGVRFGSDFPKLADLADKLAIVRSFTTRSAAHDGGKVMFSGGMKIPMGPLYARLAGTTNPRTSMPTHVLVSAESFGLPTGRDGAGTFSGVLDTGELPATFGPLHPVLEGNAQAAKQPGLLRDLELNVPLDRFSERRQLLQQLDQLERQVDAGGALADFGEIQQQAVDALLKGVRQAFDLSREDPRLVQRYDTSHMRTPQSILSLGGYSSALGKAWSPETLGKQMLLARRLCEAGCGFVTVFNHGWDMHPNAAFAVNDGMPLLGPALDHAVSAFLVDVEQRGLSDRILLVITGEMGRTPNRQPVRGRIGRDHWADLAPLILAGGGLKVGQTIGASDRQGGRPATTPYTNDHLMATVMHTLFDIGQLRLAKGLPDNLVSALGNLQPISELC